MADSGGSDTPDASVLKSESSEDKEYIADPILETDEMKKLYVGGIASDSKDEDFKAFFDGVSDDGVADYMIMRADNRMRKFGFVTFTSSELIDEILLKRSSLIFNSKTLDVNRAVPRSDSGRGRGSQVRTKKLFIANLPKTGCSEKDLRTYFEARHPTKYGTIESIQLMKTKDGEGNRTEENKGFGFIVVSTEDMADKMAIQHAIFEFGGRKVQLRKSDPTAEGKSFKILIQLNFVLLTRFNLSAIPALMEYKYSLHG